MGAEEDAAPRRDAAVCDGVAELQNAVGSNGCLSHGRTRLGVRCPGGHRDFRGHDRGLGTGLLSAGQTSKWPPKSLPSEPAFKNDPAALGRVRYTRESRPPVPPACISGTAFWARPGSGSSRPSGRSAGIGGSAARRSRRFRPAKSSWACWASFTTGRRRRRRTPRAIRIGLQAQLRAAKWDDTGLPVYNLPVALSIMVFFALCAQCAATLAVIRRETNSWRWPIFTFAYMTTLAYVGALITYQVGIRLFS